MGAISPVAKYGKTIDAEFTSVFCMNLPAVLVGFDFDVISFGAQHARMS